MLYNQNGTDVISTVNKRTNIVLIVLDTQRAHRLSCYGYSQTTSPHLDEFAAKSTLFARAIAPAQWTIPTHASIFTGLTPSQHTMLQMDSVLPAEISTLAQRLQIEGFNTIGISNNPLIGTMGNGLERGFSKMKNYNFWGSSLLNFQLNRSHRSGPQRNTFKGSLKFIAAEALGYSNQTFLNRLKLFFPLLWESFLSLKSKTKFDVTRRSLADAAKLLLSEWDKNSKPIFMFINLMGTHVPYAPPRWAVKKFSSKIANQKQFYSMRRRANQIQVDVNNWVDCSSLSSVDLEALNIFYDAEVFTQDLLLGEFFALLQSHRKLDEMFIVIVGDHGDHLGEKQQVNHAFGVYKELVHVPLIIRDPQGVLVPGSINDSLVSTKQLFHTILDVADVATLEEFDGSLRREQKLKSEGVFAQGYPLDWGLNRLKNALASYESSRLPHFAIYEDDFKLIKVGDEAHLFRLDVDPEEKNDLSAQNPEVVKHLGKSLSHFISENVPFAENKTLDFEDAVIVGHLRALGYLE